MSTAIDQMYQAVISSAYRFRTGGAHGSLNAALNSLRKRRPLARLAPANSEVEALFTLALQVVDDSLEFEETQVRSGGQHNASAWMDASAIEDLAGRMTSYLRERNQHAPSIFIEHSVNRIAYRYHWS